MKPWQLAICLLFASGAGIAEAAGSLPSCYHAKLPVVDSTPETEIFVVIDQTTVFDNSLKQSIANNLRPFLGANNAFSVIRFSAYTQGQYTEVLASATLDPLINQAARNDISKPVLAKFDQCIAQQPKQASQLAGAALKSAFGGSSTNISKSDVIGSLKDISSRVRQSSAHQKVVLIASDMLENSSVTSFYANQAVRTIQPEKELGLVEKNQLFGDFSGARVYVIGAGLLADDAKTKAVYRSPQTMQELGGFWKQYFQRSNAHLLEFGQPALLNPVR
ncbi:hypothetical protein LG201_00805 [Methylobacillus gramineus]|uniref:hypothetical protein n=1 Tax=Methylobacillus gramineus TaxID=755169 RepID=UPI001CFFBD51|nr:hypothetical protein [Methylobacillus gramineus]MCB5183743.1 hypothetical protein [Methylobacillus gramineus]